MLNLEFKSLQIGASSTLTLLNANKNHSHLDHCIDNHEGKPYAVRLASTV